MTHLYRFPSGRSVARIRKDLRTEPEIDVCRRHGVPLPLEYALEYVRERERLSLIKNPNDAGMKSHVWIPPAGGICWITGTPHQGVYQSAAMLATLAAAVTKPSKFGFCEFQLNAEEFMAPCRYSRLVATLRENASPWAEPAAELLGTFANSVADWRRLRGVWESTAPAVSCVKIPKLFKSRAPSLLTVLNPRKDMLRQVALQVRQGHRLLIGDSAVSSIADLASCKHFGIDPKFNGHVHLRALLGNTHFIGEQRLFDAGEAGQVVLRRGVHLTADERAAFSDHQRPLRLTMAVVLERLPGWGETTEAAIAQGRIGAGDDAMEAAALWDTFSRKAMLNFSVPAQQQGKRTSLKLGS